MFDFKQVRFARIVLLAGGMVLAGCNDDPVVEDEPEVATMRLTIGSQVVDVDDTGAVTGGPIALTTGVNPTVTAQWLKADGSAETLVTSGVFELRAEPANTAVVTFTRTGAFAGTLDGLTAGSTQIEFSLFHLEEGHEDFGPFDVDVTVS
ncbi:MAG: hypothetical protein AB7T31_12995 [Gemmatimonadales bacterium]